MPRLSGRSTTKTRRRGVVFAPRGPPVRKCRGRACQEDGTRVVTTAAGRPLWRRPRPGPSSRVTSPRRATRGFPRAPEGSAAGCPCSTADADGSGRGVECPTSFSFPASHGGLPFLAGSKHRARRSTDHDGECARPPSLPGRSRPPGRFRSQWTPLPPE